jgi:hypothetical protein
MVQPQHAPIPTTFTVEHKELGWGLSEFDIEQYVTPVKRHYFPAEVTLRSSVSRVDSTIQILALWNHAEGTTIVDAICARSIHDSTQKGHRYSSVKVPFRQERGGKGQGGKGKGGTGKTAHMRKIDTRKEMHILAEINIKPGGKRPRVRVRHVPTFFVVRKWCNIDLPPLTFTRLGHEKVLRAMLGDRLEVQEPVKAQGAWGALDGVLLEGIEFCPYTKLLIDHDTGWPKLPDVEGQLVDPRDGRVISKELVLASLDPRGMSRRTLANKPQTAEAATPTPASAGADETTPVGKQTLVTEDAGSAKSSEMTNVPVPEEPVTSPESTEGSGTADEAPAPEAVAEASETTPEETNSTTTVDESPEDQPQPTPDLEVGDGESASDTTEPQESTEPQETDQVDPEIAGVADAETSSPEPPVEEESTPAEPTPTDSEETPGEPAAETSDEDQPAPPSA